MLKCFVCLKIYHLKKDCLERDETEDHIHIVVTSNKDSFKIDGTLVVSSFDTRGSWEEDQCNSTFPPMAGGTEVMAPDSNSSDGKF